MAKSIRYVLTLPRKVECCLRCPFSETISNDFDISVYCGYDLEGVEKLPSHCRLNESIRGVENE